MRASFMVTYFLTLSVIVFQSSYQYPEFSVQLFARNVWPSGVSLHCVAYKDIFIQLCIAQYAMWTSSHVYSEITRSCDMFTMNSTIYHFKMLILETWNRNNSSQSVPRDTISKLKLKLWICVIPMSELFPLIKTTWSRHPMCDRKRFENFWQKILSWTIVVDCIVFWCLIFATESASEAR